MNYRLVTMDEIMSMGRQMQNLGVADAELTRLKAIERQALALLVNKGDLGMYSIREPLMADLEKAFGPYDPKQHKVQFP